MFALPLVAVLLSTVPALSDSELLRLQRVRTDVARMLRISCEDGSCVRWDERLRIWRFVAPGTLTRWVRDDDASDPKGGLWTDAGLVDAFPEFRPKELALSAMTRAAPYLWSEWLRWLAMEPARLERYGPELWGQFVGDRRSDPIFRDRLSRSPWGRPYTFEDLQSLGMTLDRLRTGVTVLRCDAVVARAIEAQRAGAPLPTGEAEDAWGQSLRLQRFESGGGQVRLGQSGPHAMLGGAAFVSAGPDRQHHTDDDFACTDPARIEGPPALAPIGYRPRPPGPYDAAIDRAIIGIRRDPVQWGPLGVDPAGPPSLERN